MPTDDRPPRRSARRGMREALPLAVAVIPFGLVYGVAVGESSVDAWVGVLASVVVFAGAAQLTLLDLIESGAAPGIGIGTALVINARFVLYSAALAPAFAAFPSRWRWPLAHLLTDQAATLSLAHNETESDPDRRRWYYLGAALLFAVFWWIGTIVGVVLGAALPDDLDIAFAVPATFLALLVPTLVRRPAVAAAVTSAAVTVLAGGLGDGVNVLLGALAGLAAGRLAIGSRR